MLRNKKAILLLLVLCICRTVMMAQDLNPSDNGNTPYSRYGYGSLADNSFVANKGMGGVGIGLRNRSQINVQNPASYTAIDSLTFLFDFGMNGQMSVFKEPGVSQTDWSAGIDYVAFQVPLGKKFAATAGLLPFSYVGYEYGNQSDLIAGEDTIAVTRKYTGNGGLNKVFLGFAYAPIKSLSVGVNMGYIWGVTSTGWSMAYSNSMGTTSSTDYTMDVKAFDLNFGIQYTHQFSKKHQATIGATYNPKMDMWTDLSEIMTLTESDTTTVTHTVNIPQIFGVGLTYVYDDRLTVGADFKRELWSEVRGYNEDYQISNSAFSDRTKIAVGGEFLPGASYGDRYYKRIKYRVGFNYNNSYVNVRNSRNDEYGFTIGVGLPLMRQKSVINVALEYATIKPQNKDFLSENFLKLNIGLAFNEMWFLKNRLK